MVRKIVFTCCLCALAVSTYSQNFIQRQGKKLVYKGNQIYLRGMAFGNLVYDDNQNPANHHTEKDMERIQALGMNAIRFYMNYKTFEADAQPYQYKQSGWDWIDKNVQWAKANGVFLILNMHVPQGGYQSACKGDALWTSTENQKRLVALWKAIATRYKDEPQIAGYDILNEPTPSGSMQNWSALAQNIINGIRSVDNNHLIITERALALNCDYNYSDTNNNYPQITETNLMYTVHLYDPFEFTHQNLDWANTGDGGKYPDNDLIVPPANATYKTGDYDNPSIKTGTNDWEYFTGTPFTVTDDAVLFGRVVFLSNKLAAGKVYYDDFELKELDAQGNIIKTIYKVNPTSGTYWWYSANGTGAYSASTTGHGDNYSVSVTGNTEAATVICPTFPFRVTKGHQYVITGWMKGENVPSGAGASISTEYYESPSKAKLAARNYEFIKNKITAYAKYIEDKGFPVYFGEFGTARNTFANSKGGAQWVKDAMHIFDSLGYHFTYHAYKESSFGYYDGWDQPVDTTTVNAQLSKVFKDFLVAPYIIMGDEVGPEDIRSILAVYPNPCHSQITVLFSDLQPIKKVEIRNLLGNVVLTSTQTTIPIQHLTKGFYIVKVSTSSRTLYRKILKE